MTREILVYTIEDLEKDPFGFDIDNLTKRDWYEISTYNELSEEFIRQYHEKLDWDSLIDSGALTESLMRDFQYYFKYPYNWEKIAMYYKLSNDFLTEFLDKFHPDVLIEYQTIKAKLLYKMMMKHNDVYGIATLALEHQLITPEKIKVIEKATEKADSPEVINWYNLSKNCKLSKKTIEMYKHEILWNIMIKYKDLSENFMMEYRDYMEWNDVSEYQKISKDFILSISDKINIERLRLNSRVNQKELEENEVYTMLELVQSNRVLKA